MHTPTNTSLINLEKTQPAPTMIHTHSKAAHGSLILENFSKRLKHVSIARQWVREQLASGVIDVQHVRTHQQPADFFTIPLPKAAFTTCCNLLGLKSRGEGQDQDKS